MMCVVACGGSLCAHCRNINGVFNCFWLRSVDWVWVKPIRRLEETLKNCLRKKALTFWQTVYGGVCCCAPVSVWVLAVWDDRSILYIRYVCMLVLFSFCTSVCMCALWVQGRKCHMADLITCCDGVQYSAFFFSPSWNQRPCMATAKISADWNQTQNSGQTWNQNRGKSHAEKPTPWFYVTYVVLNSTPLFWTVKSVSRWRQKLSVKFMTHVTDAKLHAVCEVEFPLHHVYHWAPRHWEKSLRLYWIWQFK